MIILAIDSAETTAAAAVSEDRRLIAQMSVNTGLSHSETILPMIDILLRSARVSYDKIDAFACSVGPGSFTGVRIGVSTIKGLAFGREKPCVELSALEVLAYNFEHIDGIICPCMDARRSQLYNAIFESKNGKITRLTEDRIISASELSDKLKKYEDPAIYCCGGGYEIIRNAAKDNPNLKETPEILKYQNGTSAAICAYDKLISGQSIKTDSSISPVYLRPSQAERTKAEKALID